MLRGHPPGQLEAFTLALNILDLRGPLQIPSPLELKGQPCFANLTNKNFYLSEPETR